MVRTGLRLIPYFSHTDCSVSFCPGFSFLVIMSARISRNMASDVALRSGTLPLMLSI